MFDPWPWTVLVTVLAAILAWILTVRTRQVRFTFLAGFNVLGAVALVHVLSAGPLHLRGALALASVALYLLHMNVLLLVWTPFTALPKLDAHLTVAEKHVLPFVMTLASGLAYALPFYFIARRAGPLGWLDGLGLGVYVVGTAIHFGADLQKKRFKARPASRGQILDTGLWALSRHPNYFGDLLLYVGWAVWAGSAWAWVCPALNLLQYVFDAIPKSERWAAERYGEAWSAYAARTSRFLPGWPRT